MPVRYHRCEGCTRLTYYLPGARIRSCTRPRRRTPRWATGQGLDFLDLAPGRSLGRAPTAASSSLRSSTTCTGAIVSIATAQLRPPNAPSRWLAVLVACRLGGLMHLTTPGCQHCQHCLSTASPASTAFTPTGSEALQGTGGRCRKRLRPDPLRPMSPNSPLSLSRRYLATISPPSTPGRTRRTASLCLLWHQAARDECVLYSQWLYLLWLYSQAARNERLRRPPAESLAGKSASQSVSQSVSQQVSKSPNPSYLLTYLLTYLWQGVLPLQLAGGEATQAPAQVASLLQRHMGEAYLEDELSVLSGG